MAVCRVRRCWGEMGVPCGEVPLGWREAMKFRRTRIWASIWAVAYCMKSRA